MGLDFLKLLASFLMLISISSALDCGDGWTLRPGTTLCYRLETAGKTWDNAQAACVGFGGALTSVDDTAEKTYVAAMSDIAANYVWIGLTDLAGQGIWNWQDSPCMSFTDFDAGEPNYGNGGRECVILLQKIYNYQWDDLRCGNLFPYVCRKDIGPQSENNKDCDNSCKANTACVGYTYKSGECTLHVKKAVGSKNGVTTTIVTCVKSPVVTTPAPGTTTTPAPGTTTTPQRRHRHWWPFGDADGDSAEDGDSSEDDDLIYEYSRGSHANSALAYFDRRRALSLAAARQIRLIERLLEEEYEYLKNRDKSSCKSRDKVNYVVINNNY